jgi:hypothetical protein
MIDLARILVLALAGSAAFVVLLILPGVRIAERLAGPGRGFAPRLVLSFLVSQLLVGGAGVALVAIGRFSGTALAIVAIVLGVTGLPVGRHWLGDLRRGLPTVVWITAVAAPWALFLGVAGWPPADTLQWYYAGLGSQLGAAGGIPAAVAEWGLAVRWLPDYLVFNVDSEAYLALLSFLPRADALAAWRLPAAILGGVILFLVLRLWVSRPAAAVGVAVTSGSIFWLAKFDAYKPEALGVVVGLAALWLVVKGLRHGRRSWLLLAGASLGVALSIHAIAAVVMGLVVAGFGGAEWLLLRRARWVRLDWLIRAAALGFLLSLVMGVGIQGRAAVATAALNPSSAQGADPTWTFFLRSTGDFSEPERAPPLRPLAGGVTTPWAGLRVTSAFGWWLFPVLAIGAAFLVGLGGRRPRAGVLGLALGGALVGAGVVFFAVGFSTYVPRWTGLVRFGQYAPLLASLAVTLAVGGYLRVWSWLAERRVPRATTLAVVLLGLTWLAPTAVGRFAAEPRISVDGEAALATLRQLGRPGDVVLSNILTTGTIESFTGLEDPLEGRQPLIEQPAFLAATNQLLLDAHGWFARPSAGGLAARLGVHWILVADAPATLGASATLGGGVATVRAAAGLREAWSGTGVAIFEVEEPNVPAAVVDETRSVVEPARLALVGLLGLALAILLVAPVGSIRRWLGRASRAVRAGRRPT